MELDGSAKPIILGCNKRDNKDVILLEIILGCNKPDNKDVIFGALPDDILLEIMCRLPDKQLHRYKCLSKEWRLLISKVCIPRITTLFPNRPVVGLYFRGATIIPDDPIFISRGGGEGNNVVSFLSGDSILEKVDRMRSFVGHYAYLEQEEEEEEDDNDGNGRGGQLFGWGESVISVGLPFTPDPDDFLDCSNGLLLFFDTESFQYYVCNPFTKQCVSIPLPESFPRPDSYSDEQTFYASLVFDPCKSLHYRVIRFDRMYRFDWLRRKPHESFRREILFLDIYNSENRSWSRHSVNIDPLVLKKSWLRPSIYFNGALFRLAFSWHLVEFDLEEIVSDCGDEISVCLTQLPLSYSLCNGMMGCIGVLMGKLCYANEYFSMIRIWSFEKRGSPYRGRWILRHCINICRLTRSVEMFGSPYAEEWVGPICFHPSSNILFLSSPLVILSYNLDDKSFKELIKVDRAKGAIFPGWYHPAFPYVRLLSPFDEAGNIQV